MFQNPDKQSIQSTQHSEKSLKKSYDFINYFNQSYDEIKNYFESLKTTSISQKKSDFYTYQRFINVTEQIYQGAVEINPKEFNIDHLLVKQKINQEEEKTKQLKSKKIQILQQLALLDEQVSKVPKLKNKSLQNSQDKISQSLNISRNSSIIQNQQENDTNKIGKLVLSRQQHKQIIQKIKKQRQEREKIKHLIKQKQDQKLKKIQEQLQITQNQKKQEQKRKKLQEIEQKLRKKRQQHQKFLQKQKQSQKKFKQLKNRKFLHEQIQQKYELKIKLPLLQEQKKILKQKRQFAKAYSIDEIKNHEKSYLQIRQESLKKSSAKQKEKSVQIYKAPMKSSRLATILQQEKLQQRKKLMQKKLAIEQKIHRQEHYVEYLKQNFSSIKIDKEKQQELKSRIEKSNKRKQPQIDSKVLGINYLQEAKRKRRKTAKLADEIQKQQNKLENLANNVTMLTDKEKIEKSVKSSRLDQDRKNHLLKKRQQQIQILIQDTSKKQSQRIKKLRIQSEKISEAFKMKQQMLKYGYSQKVQNEAVQLLLTSIQAKMGIIDLSKESK